MLFNKSVLEILEERDYKQLQYLPIGLRKNFCHMYNTVSYKLEEYDFNLRNIVSPYLLASKCGDVDCVEIETYSNGIELIKTVLTDLILRYKDTGYSAMLKCFKANRFFLEMAKDFGEEKIHINLDNIAIAIAEHNYIETKDALYIMDLLEHESLRGYVYDLAFEIQEYAKPDIIATVYYDELANRYNSNPKFYKYYIKTIVCVYVYDLAFEIQEYAKPDIIATVYYDELANRYNSNPKFYKYYIKTIVCVSSMNIEDLFYGSSIVHPDLIGIFSVKGVSSKYVECSLDEAHYSLVEDILRNLNECKTSSEYKDQLIVALTMHCVREPYGSALSNFIYSILLKKLVRETEYLGANLYNRLSEV